MMYATVVLDIPELNHKGFDYRIPPQLLTTIKPGCRVSVPLGTRSVQGFVIELKETTELENTSVKQIKESLDIIPSLTTEMLHLGQWISVYYSAHLFRTLQMLLPAALKTKTEESVVAANDFQYDQLSAQALEIIEWVNSKASININQLINRYQSDYQLIQDLLSTGHLIIKKRHLDKVNRKKLAYVKLLLSTEELLLEISTLSKQAIKQKQVLEYFLVTEKTEEEVTTILDELQLNRSSILALVNKGYLQLAEKEVDRDPYKERQFQDKKITLNTEQLDALSRIVKGIDARDTKPFLIHGVTGSGKTEIYLNAIEYVLKKGQEAIMLVPEISLTPQMVERFKGRFGNLVAVLHSRLSQGEKLDEWRKIQRGEAKIAIGARSAVFAPFQKLGLIIIDEEHESSYKQEEHPKYHTREIAKWRAEYNRAAVILGSATPSLESYYLAINEHYYLIEMPNRVMGRSMPAVHIVDLREELNNGNRSMFSSELQELIKDRLEKKEQIVLFLNRRGYSTFVMCRSCGYVISCPHCEISLTYHHTSRDLRCHYCGHNEHEQSTCPECGSKHIRYFGTGTQKVEEELAKRFPGVRVIRMDVDTTSTKGAHEKLLNSFKKQEADILLGTQMIAKGLDFPRVTLVGVIAADTLLKLPDFRATERTFQLLTQVSGRAGRHQLAGDVVIQTYSPEHYSVDFASRHDYKSFFSKELEQRRMLQYPPYKKLILINFSHPELKQVMLASDTFIRILKREITTDVEIIGPVASPISRIKDRYRFQCMIKYSDDLILISKINETIIIITEQFKDRKLQLSVDLDPYVLL